VLDRRVKPPEDPREARVIRGISVEITRASRAGQGGFTPGFAKLEA
jgi:hypothetical protein